MTKVIAVIQMHYTDLDYSIKEYNPIKTLKKSKSISDIILICPDMKENQVLVDFAKDNDVKIFFGDRDNVVKRIFDSATSYSADIIVRTSIRWYMIDIQLIDNMVEAMTNGQYDYVALPGDFDERFGAEVFSTKCIEKIIVKLESNKEYMEKYKFSPAAYVEVESNDLNICLFESVPTYNEEYFAQIYKKMKSNWDTSGKGNSYANRPVYPYKFAKQYVKKGSHILDIACGTGYGSNLLCLDNDATCVGVDINTDLITDAKKKFISNKNVSFVCKAFQELDYLEGSFDLIVTIHTMEHIEEDMLFLKTLAQWLKEDGKLVLEVPIHRSRPFVDVQTPLNPSHLIEYRYDDLVSRIEKYFVVEDVFGVNHGFYTGVEKMRNACMIIAKKKI